VGSNVTALASADLAAAVRSVFRRLILSWRRAWHPTADPRSSWPPGPRRSQAGSIGILHHLINGTSTNRPAHRGGWVVVLATRAGW